MTPRLRAASVSLTLCLLCRGFAALADAPAAGDAPLRASILADRAGADALYRERVVECSVRFAVTACVDAARAQRHETLGRLDREEARLDEVRRRERAAQRNEAIASKVDGDEARQREDAARQRAATGARDAAGQSPAASSASASAPRAARAASTPQQRVDQMERSRRAYDLKQLQAEAHRQEVAKRNADRARKSNPAAPLPAPAASGLLSSAPAASGLAPPAPAASGLPPPAPTASGTLPASPAASVAR